MSMYPILEDSEITYEDLAKLYNEKCIEIAADRRYPAGFTSWGEMSIRKREIAVDAMRAVGQAIIMEFMARIFDEIHKKRSFGEDEGTP